MEFQIAQPMTHVPTGEELKEIIQGPGDVEWRFVAKHGSPFHQLCSLFFATIRYEMRRDCQEIIAGLLLGPYLVSRDLEKLRKLGISHMYASIQSCYAKHRDVVLKRLMRKASACAMPRRLFLSSRAFQTTSFIWSSTYKIQKIRI